MAVRSVPKNEQTKNGYKWIYEIRINGRRYKSKKYLTKKEAQEAEYEFINEKEKTGNQSLMTLGDLFEEHYNYQKDKVKKSTLSNYADKIQQFKSIKDIKLDKLNIYDIEKWKQEMNSRNLATSTKNDLMKYLKSTLNYGTKWYDFNFTSMYNKIVNFTNPNEIPKEMQFYTYEEFKKFISVEDDLKYKSIFETLYYCGLRKGELRALTWDNVDFEEKTLFIKKNIVNVEGQMLVTTPKTRSSNRIIPVPKVLLEDLMKLKEKNKGYYSFSESWYVFGDVSPISASVLGKRKKIIAKRAGVKEIRIHDFRHSCASLLINNGANVVMIAKYLGHTKIDETLNTYSHMFKNKLDDIVNTINNLD